MTRTPARRSPLPRTLPGLLLAALALLLPAAVQAGDVTGPAEVSHLMVSKDGDDLLLTWDPVTEDAAGNPETVDRYDIYRGETPDFVPDRASFTNRVGSAGTNTFTDTGAAAGTTAYHYLVCAIDLAGQSGSIRPTRVTTPPVLSGYWTDTTIELDWTGAEPVDQVLHYLVYYGQESRTYEFVEDASLSTTYSLTGLEENVNWYIAVTAVDLEGNESEFSNEHLDPVGGTIDLRAHDESELCWGAGDCPPKPEEVQRSNGFQILVPVDFPEGDWTSVTVDFTMDSRLCTDPIAPDRCGDQNPGWNPCGDPWDRTAYLFLVLDDCVDDTAQPSCINHDNIELMHAITPFGTDAPEPDGRGIVPPRVLTLDITPFAPLLAGQRRYIGGHIGHYTPKGWWISSDFHFSKRPEQASPKKPANGFDTAFFHSSGSGLTGPFPVTIPEEAVQVFGRLFITGHGGNSDPECGQPADEFCERTNRILVDSATAWEDTPWRNCCYPRGSYPICPDCADWNSCGYPSCTFNRSGWCPGEIACHDDFDGPDGCDQDLDLSTFLTPEGTYDIQYEILDVNGSWSRSLVVYWYMEALPICGNDLIDSGEVCDGTDLGGETCQSQGFDDGTLACYPNCSGLDTSDCRFHECGNDAIDPGEVCDGTDLGGETCQSQGFDYGTLACDAGCGGYDTADCHYAECGNHICEISAGEDCISCESDCNGKQKGSPAGQYCCGDGAGTNPVDCSDPRCTDGGNTCAP